MNSTPKKAERWSWWYLLFLVQFLVVLYPPLFNKAAPTLAGLPYFYWVQLLFVFVAAILNAVIYVMTRDP
jgi:hypothetical protein